MPCPAPIPLVLDDAQLTRLRKIARAAKTPQAIALRAKIVLECAAGNTNAEVSRRRRCSVNTVREWRRRFAADPRVATLKDLPRSGRPSVVPMWVRAKLVSLACKTAILERGVSHLIFPDEVQVLPAEDGVMPSGPDGRVGPTTITPPPDSLQQSNTA